jgi:hypothetical protein
MAREEEGGDEGDSAYGWIYVATLAALCVCAPLPFWLLQRLHSDSQGHRHNLLTTTNCYLQKGSKRSFRLTRGTTT